MRNRKYSRVLLCLSAAALTGILQGNVAGAAVAGKEPVAVEDAAAVLQNDLLDIKNIWKTIGTDGQYIEGLEDVGEYVLQQAQEEAQEEIMELSLFARTNSIVGTRAYANVVNYVNVRQKPGTSSKVVGKLFSGCVATVLEDKGDWVYVNSGNVTGYVVKQYLLFGGEAEQAIANKYKPKIKVTANVLNIRSGAGTKYKEIGRAHV